MRFFSLSKLSFISNEKLTTLLRFGAKKKVKNRFLFVCKCNFNINYQWKLTFHSFNFTINVYDCFVIYIFFSVYPILFVLLSFLTVFFCLSMFFFVYLNFLPFFLMSVHYRLLFLLMYVNCLCVRPFSTNVVLRQKFSQVYRSR